MEPMLSSSCAAPARPDNYLRRSSRWMLVIGVVGLIAFVSSLVLLIVVSGDREISRSGWIGLVVAAVVVSLVFGLIGLGAGVFVRIRAKKVALLLSGQGLLAHWNYEIDENNRRRHGYVFIGSGGIYRDKMYYELNGGGMKLLAVRYVNGAPDVIQFDCQRLVKPRHGKSYWQDIVVKVPVPTGHKLDAVQVIESLRRTSMAGLASSR